MLGIIGGTGLYQIEGFELQESREVSTPFGNPSAPVSVGRLGGNTVAFLPRHGKGHTFLPTEVNYRANIWALKSVGVRKILSVSATGSLVREIEPGHLVLPNQYIDFTKGKRHSTFFGEGVVAHISTANPVCPSLSEAVLSTANDCRQNIHSHKTYACVEGPRLGSRAESFFLKSTGSHIVGMTNVPEVFLAREAQLCYATIAVATDFDCWMDDPAFHVTVDKMMELYKQSIHQVKLLISHFLQNAEKSLPKDCSCRHSLKDAVLTPDTSLTANARERLQFLQV